MRQIIDLFIQLDVIFVTTMLSGTIVKMGKGWGKLFGSGKFASFYSLFMFFVIENVFIALASTFVVFPLTSQFFYQNPSKAILSTTWIILVFNLWFAKTFGYHYRTEIIILLALNTILWLFLK